MRQMENRFCFSEGNSITVREARTFIINYYRGLNVKDFAKEKTDGIIAKTGGIDEEWENLIYIKKLLILQFGICYDCFEKIRRYNYGCRLFKALEVVN